MKKLKFFGMVILTMVLGFAVASCSSDDDNDSSSLVGTWKIISCSEENAEISSTANEIVFESNGKVSGSLLKEKYRDEETGKYEDYYARWTVNGDVLTIAIGEHGPDDQMVGTYSVNGKIATYNYYWEDCNGKWSGKDGTHYQMKLERK